MVNQRCIAALIELLGKINIRPPVSTGGLFKKKAMPELIITRGFTVWGPSPLEGFKLVLEKTDGIDAIWSISYRVKGGELLQTLKLSNREMKELFDVYDSVMGHIAEKGING